MTARFFSGVLRFRLLILVLALGVLSIGVVSLRNTSLDALPEFTPPYAEIQTESLGLSAEEVEQLITVPLEADLLNGVEGVEVIRSESVPGLSSIVLVFTPGTDVYRARQLVEERLTQAHALPNVSTPPTLLPPRSSANRVLMIGLSSTELSLIEQSVIARWTVRPQLMGVPGVANVSVWGMRDQQLQVQVDPVRLRNKRVTLNQIVSTSGNAQVVSPLTFLEASTPGTGGFVETPHQRLQVRHLLEKIADPAELAKVPVEGTGGRLQLGDVADLKVGHQPLIGDAVVSGGPGLFLVVERFPGFSTSEVTAGVESALEALRPGLSGITSDTTVFRPADYLAEAHDNLALALLLGGLLMLVAFVAFGSHWRLLVIAAVTVPLSMITAALVLGWLGHGLNALVLAGLAAASAIVVDEAVAAGYSVLRRVRAGHGAGSVATAISEGFASVRPLLATATLVAALTVVPIAVLQGRPGAFFAPMVWSYLVAVAAALLVAMTVAPALAAVVFAGWRPASDRDWPWTRRLGARYEAAVAGLSRRRTPAVLLAAALVLLGAGTLPFLKPALVPTFEDRNVVVRLDARPGTSNQRMTEQTSQVARALEAVPGVARVGAHIGRAVTGDRVVNVSTSDVWVSLTSDADYAETIAAIDRAARTVPGLSVEVTSHSTQVMRDVGAVADGENLVRDNRLDLLTGADHPVAVRLFGQDHAVLNREADRIKELLLGVDGVANARVLRAPTQPTIEIEVDLQKAQALGITPGAVRRAEATLLQGIQVGSVFEEQKVFDVIVQGAPNTRRSVADVQNLLIDRPTGAPIRLSQVAAVRTVDSPAVISRDAVSRRIDVVVDLREPGSASVVTAAIRQQLAELSFPLEYHAEVLQHTTPTEVGQGRATGFAVGIAIVGFLIFQAVFGSWRLALGLAAAVPLALVGGLVATLLAGAVVSLGALLGLLTVFGFTVRTGLLMIPELQAADRAAPPGTDRSVALASAARIRLVPVLTSALALALLALPFVILGSRPGLEIVHPLAVVVLGGMLTATAVTVFLLPGYYRWASRSRARPENPATASVPAGTV